MASGGGVRIPIIADASGVKRGVDEAESHLRRLGEAGKHIFAGFAVGAGFGAALGLEQVLKGSVDAATEAERSQAKLQVSVKNAGLAWRDQAAGIDEALTKGRSLAFTDNQMRESLAITIRRTHDLKDAWQLTSVAMDLARAKNIDLESATTLVARAIGGNSRAVKALGIDVGKHATGLEIMHKLQQALHGDAERFAGTDAGKIAQFQAQWQHVQEVVGEKILPLLVSAMQGVTHAIQWLQQEWAKHHKEIERVASEVWQRIVAIAKWAWDHFGAYIKDIWQQVQNVVKLVRDIINGDWSKVWSDAVSIVKTFIKEMFDLLSGAVSGIADAGLSLGKAIGTGILNGVIWGLNQVIGAINSVFHWFASHWPDVPGLPGPPGFLKSGIPTIGTIGGGGGSGPASQIGAANAGDRFTHPTASGSVSIPSPTSSVGSGDPLAGGGFGPGGGASGGGSGGHKVIRRSGGAAKKTHVDLSPAIRFAQAQVGKAYSQAQRLGPNSWDCSGFAGAVAAHVPGYRGGVGGTTYTYYPISFPAKGDEPVLWGFTEFGAAGHNGPGHMGIRLDGTWYQAGSTATGVFEGHASGEFSVLRIPPGLAYLSAPSTMIRGRTSGPAHPAVAPDVVALLKHFPLAPPAQALPSGPDRVANMQIQTAGNDAYAAAYASGVRDPALLRKARDDAVRKATEAWIRSEIAKENARVAQINQILPKLRAELKKLLKLWPKYKRRGAGNAKAVEDQIAKLRQLVNDYVDELLGSNAYIADLISQGNDLGIQDIEAAAASTTSSSSTSSAADQQLQTQLATAQAGELSADQFITTALGPGDIERQTGMTAWEAAGGSVSVTVQALHPGDPSVLRAIIEAVTRGITIQGGIPVAQGSANNL